MLKIGSHVGMSSKEYLVGSVKEALSYNANTFMFYTGAPQNTIRTPLSQLRINEFRELLEENNININDIVVHAPYLINLGNIDYEKSNFSYNVLLNEVKRTLSIGIRYLVLHPGASLDYDRYESMNQVSYFLNKVIDDNPEIVILLETMAGKGSELGKTFEEIKYMIDRIERKESIGVCLDTCHIHDAGYDLSNFDNVLDDFDSIIGLEYLKVVHLNDSKNMVASHKDRHENIGYGLIGFDNLMNIVYSKRLENRIFILETPYIKQNEKSKLSFAPYKYEIQSIRNRKKEENLTELVLNENLNS